MNRPALLKIFFFWVLFVLLHYAYDWFGHPALSLISQTRETFFQHAKIGLFAYSIVSGGELWLRGRLVGRYIWSRMLSTLLLPWIMFVLYYTGPAIYGRPMPSIIGEIVYANTVLLAVVVTLAILERSMDQAAFTRPAQAATVLLFVLAVAEMVIFSYRLPWAPFF